MSNSLYVIPLLLVRGVTQTQELSHKKIVNKCCRPLLLTFEVLTAVTMKIPILWNVISCGLVDIYRYFRSSRFH